MGADSSTVDLSRIRALVRTVDTDRPLERLLEWLSLHAGAETAVVDERGSVLVSVPSSSIWDLGPEASDDVSCHPVLVAGSPAVELRVRGPGPSEADVVRLVADLLGQELTRRHRARVVEARHRGELVMGLVGSRLDGAHASELHEVTRSDRHHVVLYGRVTGDAEMAAPWPTSALVWQSADPFTRAVTPHGLLLIVPPELAKLASRTFLEHLERIGPDPRVGVSSPYAGPDGLRLAHRQALTAVGSASPRSVAFHQDADLLTTLLAVARDSRIPLAEIARARVSSVLAYDEVHGTSLMETLRAFVDSSATQDELCRRLFIHRNTLRNRLQTITDLTASDPRNPRDLADYWLALRVLGLPEWGTEHR